MQLLKQHKMKRQIEANAIMNWVGNSSQKRKQDNDNTLHILLGDLMLEILTRIPAKHLLSSAKCVCKPWAAIIRDSHFVKRHLLRAKPGIFLQNISKPYGAHFLEMKENGEFELTELNPRCPGRFLNSCDGLSLFYQCATGAVYVANPITLQVARVPNLLGSKLMYPPCAIVRVPHSGEFKLFATDVQKRSGARVCNWYVLRLGIDDSWIKFNTESSNLEFKCTPIYTGGCYLYWITEHRVIALDIDKETFHFFPNPPRHRLNSQYLRMGDCLSSITFLPNGYDIHILNIESGKWTLFHQIGALNYGDEIFSEFFAVWLGEEVIIKAIVIPSLSAFLFGYNVGTKQLRRIDAKPSRSYDVGLHTNSLVSWGSTPPY